jgi:hypothetical protein
VDLSTVLTALGIVIAVLGLALAAVAAYFAREQLFSRKRTIYYARVSADLFEERPIRLGVEGALASEEVSNLEALLDGKKRLWLVETVFMMKAPDDFLADRDAGKSPHLRIQLPAGAELLAHRIHPGFATFGAPEGASLRVVNPGAQGFDLAMDQLPRDWVVAVETVIRGEPTGFFEIDPPAPKLVSLVAETFASRVRFRLRPSGISWRRRWRWRRYQRRRFRRLLANAWRVAKVLGAIYIAFSFVADVRKRPVWVQWGESLDLARSRRAFDLLIYSAWGLLVALGLVALGVIAYLTVEVIRFGRHSKDESNLFLRWKLHDLKMSLQFGSIMRLLSSYYSWLPIGDEEPDVAFREDIGELLIEAVESQRDRAKHDLHAVNETVDVAASVQSEAVGTGSQGD